MSSRSIILRKTGGFYQSFDDDALIISYLFNYKVINYKCGFPVSAFNKVINTLEDKSINYIVKDSEEVIRDFKKKNNYDKYLEKSRIKDSINKRINNILNKLDNMDKDNLDKILTMIEDNIYE